MWRRYTKVFDILLNFFEYLSHRVKTLVDFNGKTRIWIRKLVIATQVHGGDVDARPRADGKRTHLPQGVFGTFPK